MLRKIFQPYAVILIVALYIVFLGYKQDLDLYIHPRYIVFTISLSVIALILILVDRVNGRVRDHGERFTLSTVPLIIVLGCALLFPARSLTSATVSQRDTGAVSIDTVGGSGSVANIFAKSSQALQLDDWARVLESNPQQQYYENKTAKVSGFVFDDDSGDDIFKLARFVVTCCAIDARPIGVPVNVAGWKEQYPENQWLEITGTFKEVDTINGKRIVLVPTQVTKIDEPEDPYAN